MRSILNMCDISCYSTRDVTVLSSHGRSSFLPPSLKTNLQYRPRLAMFPDIFQSSHQEGVISFLAVMLSHRGVVRSDDSAILPNKPAHMKHMAGHSDLFLFLYRAATDWPESNISLVRWVHSSLLGLIRSWLACISM